MGFLLDFWLPAFFEAGQVFLARRYFDSAAKVNG
jgi:hypothetical protein